MRIRRMLWRTALGGPLAGLWAAIMPLPAAATPPNPEHLLFAATTDGFPAYGAIGAWTPLVPTGAAFAVAGGNPTAQSFGGAKWERNLRSQSDAYRLVDSGLPPPPQGWMPAGYFTSAIPVSGASVVVAIKPVRTTAGDSWNSIVDIFYQRLVLGIRNDTGQLVVWRNNVLFDSGGTTIPDGQRTIVSLVVQPTGAFKVFTNGSEIMNVVDTSHPMTELNPTFSGGWPNWGSDEWYTHYINLGRNQPDGWSTYNGYLGDVYVYTNALSDTDRAALEADLTARFITHATNTHTITAFADAGGTISPSGDVAVLEGEDQTFTIVPDTNFAIANVLVDGVSAGAATSHMFASVATAHVIAASFMPTADQTITASAGPHGTISPSGEVVVAGGGSQTFAMVPDSGYRIAEVWMDGVSVGAPAAYTFYPVVTSHTISVSFVAIDRNLPRTDQLLFAAVTESLPGDGLPTGAWPAYLPTGRTLAVRGGAPVVEAMGSVKWARNSYASGDGYRFGGACTSPIPCSGATILAAVIPMRHADSWWSSVVNVFFDDLMLNVRNPDGVAQVVRKGVWYHGPALPDGVPVVLSAVVQPDGQLKLYTNGVEAMSTGAVEAYTQMTPGPDGYKKYINVGRSDPDGWTAFNGNIGDVFVYRMALSDEQRAQVETILSNKIASVPPVANYRLSASPSSFIVAQGGQGAATIAVAPLAGFTGAVSLVASGLPAGVTAEFTPPTATHTSTLTLTVGGAAAPGSFDFTITGASGGAGRTIGLGLMVTTNAAEPYVWPAYSPNLDYNFTNEYPALGAPTGALDDCSGVAGTGESGWWCFRYGSNKNPLVTSAAWDPMLARFNTDFAYFRDVMGWPPDKRAKRGYHSAIYLYGSGLCTDTASNTAPGGWMGNISYDGEDWPMALLSYYPVYSFDPACPYPDKLAQQGAVIHEGIHALLADMPGGKNACWFQEGGNTWLQGTAHAQQTGDYSAMGWLSAGSLIAPFMPIECYSGWLQDGSFGGPCAEGVYRGTDSNGVPYSNWRNILGGVQYSEAFPHFMGEIVSRGSVAWIWRKCTSRVLEGLALVPGGLGNAQTRRLIMEYRARAALCDFGAWSDACQKLLRDNWNIAIAAEGAPAWSNCPTWTATCYAATTNSGGTLTPDRETLPGWSGANQIPLTVAGTGTVRVNFTPLGDNLTCQLVYSATDGSAVYSQPVSRGPCRLRLDKPVRNQVVLAVVCNTDYAYLGESTRTAKFDYRLELGDGVLGAADIHTRWFEPSEAPAHGYDAYVQQIANPAARGEADDPDGDGYANLLEYVTGGSPTNVDQAARLSATRTNGSFAVEFTRNTNSADARLIVEGSHLVANDAPWSNVAVNSNGLWSGATVLESSGSNPVRVTVPDTMSSVTSRLLRLRVTRP